MSGYGDTVEWRSLDWAMREMAEYYFQLGLTRSAQDLYDLWFNRESYVRKYHPELLNG